MAKPEDHPLARRYRAARAWADLEQDELAKRLGLDRQTVIRRESGEKLPKAAELIAVASVCGVPEEFMLNGFANEVVASGEVATIRQHLGDQAEALDVIARVLRPLLDDQAAAQLRELREQLGLPSPEAPGEDDQSSDEQSG